MAKTADSSQITKSSTAEYFAKNLQQVGFSSPAKAVLTTLKEAVDNALDACEEHGILPEITILIEKKGKGSMRQTDRLLIRVEDNGPGLDAKQVPMVFGEYLASSKFGRGRCSRGQQGIGISAATTWAVQTTATGARIITKQPEARKALSCLVVTDLKANVGILKDKASILWDRPHGTSVEFLIDGRLQLNGEGGVLAYLRGSLLLNPHLTLRYQLPDMEAVTIQRVSHSLPRIPPALPPHPHTMKLGEFISHARLFGRLKLGDWLQKGFSRISAKTAEDILTQAGMPLTKLQATVASLSTEDFKQIFQGLQAVELRAPSTHAVMAVGEEALAMSIQRLGAIDYFSVVSRRPAICDYKPVQVEVAIARLAQKNSDADEPLQILRFANRVPLQFDKAACAIVKAIATVNWKPYGLKQTKGLLPTGPYIIAVSVISPFIKFKNASKETIDASDELVTEIRKALMKAGLNLSRHLKREFKAKELESKRQHIEKFCPILVETLCRILDASERRRQNAEEGLRKLLGRDDQEAKKELVEAEEKLSEHLQLQKQQISNFFAEDERLRQRDTDDLAAPDEFLDQQTTAGAKALGLAKPKTKKTGQKASPADQQDTHLTEAKVQVRAKSKAQIKAQGEKALAQKQAEPKDPIQPRQLRAPSSKRASQSSKAASAIKNPKEKLSTKKASTKKLSSEKSTTKKLSSEKPTTKKLSTKKLSTKKLSTKKLSSKKSTTKKLSKKKLSKKKAVSGSTKKSPNRANSRLKEKPTSKKKSKKTARKK